MLVEALKAMAVIVGRPCSASTLVDVDDRLKGWTRSPLRVSMLRVVLGGFASAVDADDRLKSWTRAPPRVSTLRVVLGGFVSADDRLKSRIRAPLRVSTLRVVLGGFASAVAWTKGMMALKLLSIVRWDGNVVTVTIPVGTTVTVRVIRVVDVIIVVDMLSDVAEVSRSTEASLNKPGKMAVAGVVSCSRVVTTSFSGFGGATIAESVEAFFAGVESKSREESALDRIMLKISSSRVLILSRMVCRWCWETWIVIFWASSDARAAMSFGAWCRGDLSAEIWAAGLWSGRDR